MKPSPRRICILFSAALLFLAWGPSIIAESVRKPSHEDIRALGEEQPGRPSINAMVTVLDLLGDGRARVTFSELKQGEGPIDHRIKPQLKDGGRRIIWNYSAAGRPVPVCKGLLANVTIDSRGEVVEVHSDISLEAYRIESGGTLEVIAKPWTKHGDAPPRMHLRPHWLGRLESDSILSLAWSRKFGLLITVFEAGPGETEVEDLSGIKKGISVGNEKDFTYLPGRDGWKLVPAWTPSSKSKIPPQQEIWAAG